MNRDCFKIDHQVFFCDELLATVISFLDFKSAVTFTLCHGHDLMETGFFKSQQYELSIRCFNALWREMFHRHYFSPPMLEYHPLLLEDASDGDGIIAIGTATKRTNGGCSSSSTGSSQDSRSCNTRIPGSICNINYLEECYHRLDLLDKLTYEHRRRREEEENCDDNDDEEEEKHPLGRHRRDHFQSRSSVPRKCFHFLPITPSASSHVNHHPLELLNYPPVDFPCSSYHLTSPGVEGEYVFLNPFDGEVAVFPNIQMHRDSMVQVDDCNAWAGVARVEQEMYSNHDLIQQQDDEMVHQEDDDDDGYGDHYDYDDDDYEYGNDNYYYYGDDDDDDDHSEKQKEPMVVGEKEVLFGVQDYFRLNLHEYFHEHNHNAGGNWSHPSSFQTLSVDDEEVVVDWMGVDVHNMVDTSGNIIGNMICAAREISVDSATSSAAAARVPTYELWNAQERANQQSMSRVKSCTEVMAWKKMIKQGKYADARYTCRLDGSPYYMEVCPVKDRVYVCFSPGQLSPDEQESDDRVESIHRNNSVTHDEDPHVPPDETEPQENFMSDVDVMAIKRTRCIQMFPLLKQTKISKCDDKSETTSIRRTCRRFFPNVQQKFWSKYPVASLAIEPTGGHIIVGTDNGAIEIWNVQNEPILVQHTDISSQLMCKKTNVSIENSWMESMTTQINSDQSSSENSDSDQSERLERLHEVMLRSHDTNEPFQRRVSYASALDHLNESILRDEIPNDEEILGMSQSMESVVTDEYMGVQESSSDRPLCQCNPHRMIQEIILARHLAIQKSGFVTLQHHRDEGTTLALWQFEKQTSSFVVSSLVNLPLSTQRRPSVLYDGKKLVVFGQDHIGLIILIYRVISSPEDRALNFSPPLLKGKSNSSWGVVNLNGIDTIVYMNRIRHAALGGIEYYDNILMTMNERFLIVNTKTGNLLAGGHRERTDGLLVIDLEL